MKALAKAMPALGLTGLSVYGYSVHFGGAGWVAFGAVVAVLSALDA